MKSLLKVFSKLDKIVRQTVIRLFKLTDFFPGFYFRVLRQQFGYF